MVPQVVRGPPAHRGPVAEGVPDDAGLVWTDPAAVELERLRRFLQVGHRAVQVEIWKVSDKCCQTGPSWCF